MRLSGWLHACLSAIPCHLASEAKRISDPHGRWTRTLALALGKRGKLCDGLVARVAPERLVVVTKRKLFFFGDQQRFGITGAYARAGPNQGTTLVGSNADGPRNSLTTMEPSRNPPYRPAPEGCDCHSIGRRSLPLI